MSDYGIETKPRFFREVVKKVSKGGYFVYDAASIQQMVHDIEEKYKKDYVKPESVPYNRNMARQFPKSDEESREQRVRKCVQAETSRVSRDKNKYMRLRIEEDNDKLKAMLRHHCKRLMNLEGYVNEVLVKNGKPPIDWQNVWEDDALSVPDDSDENAENDPDMTIYGDCSDQCMSDFDGSDSDGGSLTIYEPPIADIHSGEENAWKRQSEKSHNSQFSL